VIHSPTSAVHHVTPRLVMSEDIVVGHCRVSRITTSGVSTPLGVAGGAGGIRVMNSGSSLSWLPGGANRV